MKRVRVLGETLTRRVSEGFTSHLVFRNKLLSFGIATHPAIQR